jgi:hypothetical protein
MSTTYMTVIKRKKSSTHTPSKQDRSQQLGTYSENHQPCFEVKRFASCKKVGFTHQHLFLSRTLHYKRVLKICSHESNDVNSKQHRHHPCPPPMLIHCTIITPSPEHRLGRCSRPLGWPLTPEQFLEVNPFSLWLRQQSSARLCSEVPNDDTSFRIKKWRSQVNE